MFERYTLIRVLGRGGMGVVWLAHDEELDLDVALKFLPPEISRDDQAIKELKRETRRALALTHPNMVRVFDFVSDNERAAISMEYVDGPSLSALKVQKPDGCFDCEEIAPWIKQLCAALEYAHRVPQIVHQDLKPSNLMLDSKGRLKVADFGISRSITDSMTRVTVEDTVGGTLVYMSPQQMNGEKPVASNDIYSLGATIYDLLTGKPPFHTGALYQQIETKVPPTMADRRVELEVRGKPVPPAWEETVAACLAKKPEQRPGSAMEVARRLNLASGADAVPLPPRPVRKPASLLWIVATALLLAAVLLIPGIRNGHRPGADPAPRSAPKRSQTARVVDSLPRLTNSLEMVFVELGDVHYAIWETRVKDFRAFVEATGYKTTDRVVSSGPSGTGYSGATWQKPGFEQGPDHPVVAVSQLDAVAFCAWLTKHEAAKGMLPADREYRLPTDAEWSLAVGLTNETGATPAGRDLRIRDVYPWGGPWPPPADAGNYEATGPGFKYSAPVGSFAPNRYGIHDLGGNAFEWCLDAFDGTFDATRRDGTLRGAAFWHKFPDQMMSSRRRWQGRVAEESNTEFGFRCVLASKPREIVRAPAELAPRRTNSLGMVFSRAGQFYACIWETRVQDFEAFVSGTRYDASGELLQIQADGSYQRANGGSWKDPGFPQGPTHPVVGVNRADADAFCQWLTERERRDGTLEYGYRYRLPTDREWSHAAGVRKESADTPSNRDNDASIYPWGQGWPPPPKAGNYEGSVDGFAATAPVGRFAPNALGLFDLGGNIWEWCDDVRDRFQGGGTLRGASFADGSADQLASGRRRDGGRSDPGRRDVAVGFRCVLAPEPFLCSPLWK